MELVKHLVLIFFSYSGPLGILGSDEKQNRLNKTESAVVVFNIVGSHYF